MTPSPRTLLVAAALLAAGRGLPAQVVGRVQVAPPSASIKVGEKYTFIADAYDRAQNIMLTARFTWTSNNRAVAVVDQEGTVTGVAPGVALITAAIGNRNSQAVVRVDPAAGGGGGAPPAGGGGGGAPQGGPPPVVVGDPFAGQPAGTGPAAVVRVEPSTVYLLVGENTRVQARALREDGSPASPVRPSWSSLRPEVASVDAQGTITGLSAGQGIVQVAAPVGQPGTAQVIVQHTPFQFRESGTVFLSPAQWDTLQVIVAGQNNRMLNPLQLQWTSTAPNIVTVDLNGVLRAVGSGRADVIVQGYLMADTIAVNVHRTVEFLIAVPRSTDVILALQSSLKFEARAEAADNTPVSDAPIRWAVADTTVVSFDTTTGLLRGHKIGRTTVTVRAPGRGLEKTWTVTVIAGNVRLNATRFGLGIGETRELRASFVDDGGNIVAPASGVLWSTSDGDVAAVNESGMVTGGRYGRATITATAPGGRSAAVEVFVQGEIVLASNRTGYWRLYAVERNNLAAPRAISPDTIQASDPGYSPDGSRIAFVSTRGGNADVFVMDADGQNVQRLTSDSGYDGAAAWSPDGQELYFHSDRTGNPQIWVVGVDGTGLRRLTQEVPPPATETPQERRRRLDQEQQRRQRGEPVKANFNATLSPDGRTVAFVSTREGNFDIWLMARDGSTQRNFTGSPQQKEFAPHFLRDGSLAYIIERRTDNNRVTTTQLVKADLASGTVTPISGTDLNLHEFAVSPKLDYVAVVVSFPGQRRGQINTRIHVGAVGAALTVVPTALNEQMTSPTFRP